MRNMLKEATNTLFNCTDIQSLDTLHFKDGKLRQFQNILESFCVRER